MAPSSSPINRDVRREMNAAAVGAAETDEASLEVPAEDALSPCGAPRRRRGHAKTAPREDCTRSIAGSRRARVWFVGGLVAFVSSASPEQSFAFAFVFVPGKEPTSGVHGAIRSSVVKPRRATFPGAQGDAAVATTRRGPERNEHLFSPIWISSVCFSEDGQNGKACPTATQPTCASAFVSSCSATATIAFQSSSVSGRKSTNAATGALGRPETRTASPSRTPRQSASASGISM
mmetsp:Transcript_13606/g.57185  ORF Transcript_13606/g.57185 Transcript_13606/m.57185 type:complete len:234 (+) Transcript_13606:2818-3519(+)